MLLSSAVVEPGDKVRRFYLDALGALDEAGDDYLIGGGYAMACYTGIRRDTKDLDLFVRAEDHRRILQTLEKAGYRTEYFYPFWIAKALAGEEFIDILYNSGNGIARVDDGWFRHAVEADVLGRRARLVPSEEQLWSKAFVMDRDRFDGGDVLHLILHCGRDFDWERLLRRFAQHERVLLSHLVLFDYAYPSERDVIPDEIRRRLLELAAGGTPEDEKVCYGTMVSQKGFLADVNDHGFKDGRLLPHGTLTPEELAQLM